MRALLTSPPGGWSNTKLTNVELREGRPDQVLVQIKAVGLNPADNHQIEGRYPGGPKPPFIPGRDSCGVVVQGDKAGLWKAGDRVVTLQSTTTDLQHGTLCEQQWIAAENLVQQTSHWNEVESAAAPLVYLTAWKALFDVGELHPGQSVVITGASGGVGLAAVQLAKACGAKVVALSRSTDKQQRLLDVGADHVFSPDDAELKDHIFGTLGVKGVNLVVDNVGGPSLKTAVHLLGLRGRVSVVGVMAGIEGSIPIPALMFKRLSVHGVLVTDATASESLAAWKQIVELATKNQFRPIIDSQFPLEQAAAAFEKLRGDVFGKVVVRID